MIKNLLLSFETLASGKTIDDACILLSDLGYNDKILLVGQKGITNLGRICADPKWAALPMDKTLVRFCGGPKNGKCKTLYTASVRSLLVDRLIRNVLDKGLNETLDSIRIMWDINVQCP
jgi:hypothetical protein